MVWAPRHVERDVLALCAVELVGVLVGVQVGVDVWLLPQHPRPILILWI